MSLFGWLLALTYLGLELYHRQRSVGHSYSRFILVFFLAAHLAPADRLSPPAVHGAVFAFHVTLSILAYAASRFPSSSHHFSGGGAAAAQP